MAVVTLCCLPPFPLQCFSLLLAAALLFLAISWLARGTGGKYVCIILFSLGLAAALIEYRYYELVKEDVGIDVERGGIFTRGLARKDPVLGYAPVPGARVPSRVVRDGNILYDVTYTMNKNGWRITYPAPAAQTAVVFFGCSFTMGEGVQDDENFAWLVGKLAAGRYQVFNYSLSGYGPHHMLAQIQHGLPELVGFKHIVAFHVAIRGHQRRVAGLSPWDGEGPRYFLENGKVVRRGTFADNPPFPWEGPLEPWLARSYAFLGMREQLSEWLGPINTLEGRLRLNKAIIAASARELRRQFPNASFRVLAWPPDTACLLHDLAKDGIAVLDVEAWLPGYAQRRTAYCIPGDGHPNAHAHALAARHILELLDREK